MIGFWIIAGLLMLAALAGLLRPLLRRADRGADEAEPAVALFRQQLADIDTELAQGRFTSDQAAAARTEITRRMLAAADRGEQGSDLAPDRTVETSWRIGAAVGIAAILPAAALAIYFAVGAPAAIERGGVGAPASRAGPHDGADLAAVAEQLKARLEREPGHPEGWALLGRTLASLERFAEARDAYAHAVALNP